MYAFKFRKNNWIHQLLQIPQFSERFLMKYPVQSTIGANLLISIRFISPDSLEMKAFAEVRIWSSLFPQKFDLLKVSNQCHYLFYPRHSIEVLWLNLYRTFLISWVSTRCKVRNGSSQITWSEQRNRFQRHFLSIPQWLFYQKNTSLISLSLIIFHVPAVIKSIASKFNASAIMFSGQYTA